MELKSYSQHIKTKTPTLSITEVGVGWTHTQKWAVLIYNDILEQFENLLKHTISHFKVFLRDVIAW